jgi:hypothetical protein
VSAFADDPAANGARARAAYLDRYTPQAVTEQLVRHYQDVTATR